MNKKWFFSISISFFLLVLSSVSFGKSVTLSWDQSPQSKAAGYKIYYKAKNGSEPFDGTGAQEGPSPIDVGSVTSFTLNGLDDREVYFFSVKAYNEDGVESGPSKIIGNGWVPVLASPQIASEEIALSWSAPPDGSSVTYTLFIGTSPPSADNSVQGEEIFNITENSYSVRDLEPGNQYYWKVVATDHRGEKRESEVGSFTT